MEELPAPRTEDRDVELPRQVRQAGGQDRLSSARDPRTASEVSPRELLEHLLEPFGGVDVARVDESVEHLGRALDDVLLAARESLFA